MQRYKLGWIRTTNRWNSYSPKLLSGALRFFERVVLLPSVKVRAMDSTDAPVSTAVELETLVISALRNFSGSRRYGLVSMSGFCSMRKL